MEIYETNENKNNEVIKKAVKRKYENRNNARVFETPFIPNTITEAFELANTHMYYTKNKYKQLIKVGVVLTEQECEETGELIKCFNCPIGENEFGICKDFKTTEYNDINLQTFQTSHWKRNHDDLKKRHTISIKYSFEETIEMFNNKRNKQLIKNLKKKNQVKS